MPPQRGKSGILAKYAGQIQQAIAEHKDDPIDLGIQDLPGGISNGVAKLVECKFELFKSGKNKGEPGLFMSGVAVAPQSVADPETGADVPVAGKQTRVNFPVCNTVDGKGVKVSVKQNFAKAMNEMKKLGLTDFSEDDDVEELAAALKDAAPYFRFVTELGKKTKEFPNPRVWTRWQGTEGLEDYSPPDSEDVQDDTGEGVEPEEEPAPARPTRPVGKTTASLEGVPFFGGWAGVVKTAVASPTSKPAVTGKPGKLGKPSPEPVEEFDETAEQELGGVDGDTLAATVEAANNGDETAQEELRAQVTEEEYDGTADWEAVAAIIRDKQGASAAEDAETEAVTSSDPENEGVEWTPSKGDVFMFKPIDAKTGRPRKKGVEVEVVAVDLKTKSVKAKDLSDNKTVYAGVAWGQLEGAE